MVIARHLTRAVQDLGHLQEFIPTETQLTYTEPGGSVVNQNT
jgi:hypothetical protein